jgi:A/G-specific adenine glycosylase
VALLPVKSKAKAARTRYFHYFVLRHGEQTYLRERREKDIWQGLYDFALAETAEPELPAAELSRHLDALGAALDTSQAAEPTAAYRHVLSHQKLEVRFHPMALTKALPEATVRDLGLRAYSVAEIEALPKPQLIANYVEQNLRTTS